MNKLNKILLISMTIFCIVACKTDTAPDEIIEKKYLTPDEMYPDLFKAVQMSDVFEDSKTFVDCTAKKSPEEINKLYTSSMGLEGFELEDFVKENFIIPPSISSDFKSDTSRSAVEHVEVLWDVLTRPADRDKQGSTLIPLPEPYIVPGGRFREVYYWDSYFTMLGLLESERYQLVEHILDNFAYLIDEVGHIPNGNRVYYKTRSQPPFFSQMVDLFAQSQGDHYYEKYADALLKEYDFWMDGSEELRVDGDASLHTVMLDGGIINRYYDKGDLPRQESYREDYEQVERMNGGKKMYRDLRSGAESGWDYSSRWFADKMNINKIETTDIIPIDLNALLYGLEEVIVKHISIDDDKVQLLKDRMAFRKEFLMQRCFADDWSLQDYNFKKGKKTGVHSLAMVYPLFFGMLEDDQAQKVIKFVKTRMTRPGGVVTSLHSTGQQWDAPNGWAPLQWMTVKGLMRYGQDDIAMDIAQKWVTINELVYKNTGKFVEKYNVEDLTLKAGGGEYPVQDGFGWSNGVYLALKNMINNE